MLLVEKVHKTIDAKPILADISFSVPDGELVAITGSSGSGKTTLLKCIMGIYRPDSGSISLAGNEYSNLSDDKARAFRLQNIGVVDQQNRLIEDLTCLDNIRLIAAMSGQKKKESFESARGILARMGMEEYAERYPRSLSGGERQRISIACALANNPSLIAADEPTSRLLGAARHRLGLEAQDHGSMTAPSSCAAWLRRAMACGARSVAMRARLRYGEEAPQDGNRKFEKQ